MARYIIDKDKRYKIPEELSIRYKDGVILVISPNTANWIVLSNEDELSAFYYLKDGSSIFETQERYGIVTTRNVIIQLEAKQFCNKEVKTTGETFKHMHLYLTNKCNLLCPHCYMYAGKPLDNELNTSELFQLFNDFRKYGGTNITLSGGEPTVRSDFDEIVEYAYSLDLKIRILSNGVLWTDERVKKLACKIDSIQISVDGYSEETNSIVRGKNHFSKALNVIDTLVSAGVNVTIAITPPYAILKNNLDEYAKFASELGQKYKEKNFLIKFSEGLLDGRDTCPSKSLNDAYFNCIQELRKRLHGPNYEIVSFARAINQDIIMDNCMFGVFTISSNGDVYMCARTSDLRPVANIRTDSFSTIVNISECAAQASHISHLRPCNKCDIRYICGGGCRIDEFPSLVKERKTFEEINYESVSPRECHSKMRDKFYSLMIKSNPYLYRPL